MAVIAEKRAGIMGSLGALFFLRGKEKPLYSRELYAKVVGGNGEGRKELTPIGEAAFGLAFVSRILDDRNNNPLFSMSEEMARRYEEQKAEYLKKLNVPDEISLEVTSNLTRSLEEAGFNLSDPSLFR